MSLYAIGDLHFSTSVQKPMNIFGDKWYKHEEKIINSWKNNVKDEDVVLVLGDTSWGINLNEAKPDLDIISNLPGNKIFIKGNHDYWWTTLAKMREFLQENKFENIDFLYNNSYLFEDKIIAGTRGWALNDTENSNKMNHREEERLKLSLQSGVDNFGDKEIICIMHYPPTSNYVQIMKQYNVKTCLYGHLHGESHKEAFEGIIDGINFKLVSSDYLDFKLYKLE